MGVACAATDGGAIGGCAGDGAEAAAGFATGGMGSGWNVGDGTTLGLINV